MAEFDSRLMPALVEQWKRMAACALHERSRPRDGRIQIEAALRSARG